MCFETKARDGPIMVHNKTIKSERSKIMSWFKDNDDLERVDRYKVFSGDYKQTDVYNDNAKVAEEVVRYDSHGNPYRDVYIDGKKVDSYYE